MTANDWVSGGLTLLVMLPILWGSWKLTNLTLIPQQKTTEPPVIGGIKMADWWQGSTQTLTNKTYTVPAEIRKGLGATAFYHQRSKESQRSLSRESEERYKYHGACSYCGGRVKQPDGRCDGCGARR